jgi:3-deoxy-D-manno-octulosonic acid kinase
VRDRYRVPAALTICVEPRKVLVYLPLEEGAVRRVAARPDDLPRGARSGRGSLGRLEGESGPLLVRTYRKGGLLRHVRGRRFHGRWRPLDELALHLRLAAVGVPVPEAVGCVVLRGGWGWRGFLVLREVAPAQDLEAFLYGVQGAVDAPPVDVLHTAGRAVRALHDAGVEHVDLHPKNLLVRPDGTVLVLDLDRARHHEGSLPDALRLAGLVRMGRAIEKHRLKGLPTGRREALRFLEGYAGDREAASAWLDRIRKRLRRASRLRVLWWRLLGEARPWRGGSA